MHADSKQLTLLNSILETIFVAMVELTVRKNLEALEPLVRFEMVAETIPDFSESAFNALPPLAEHQTESLLLLNHYFTTKKMLALRALPFLPDETRAEFSMLQVENKRSWEHLKERFQNLLSGHVGNLDSSLIDRLDFTFVTFVEWLGDVDFFKSLPLQRRDYLSEFPFFR